MVTIDELNPDVSTMVDLSDDPDVISIDEAGSLFETLSSEKRRAILVEVSRKPNTTAELANRVGTSVQNAVYHLQKLQEVGLIEVVGTHYSEKGLNMDVYGPTTPAIVIDVLNELTTESEKKDRQAVPAQVL